MKTKKMSMIAIMVIAMSLFAFSSVGEKTVYSEDFISEMDSQVLSDRFEMQFKEIETVLNVTANYNSFNDVYYYEVDAISPDGNQFNELYKTTKEEIDAGIYDYIKINENTIEAAVGGRYCREDYSRAPNWCHPTNVGPVCGYETRWGGCIYY